MVLDQTNPMDDLQLARRQGSLGGCSKIKANALKRHGDVKGPSRPRVLLVGPESEASSTVHTITLDEFAKLKRWPSFIKIDVEGAEIMVLEGARQILQGSYPPKFLIEFHGDERGRCLLEDAGYRFFTLDRVSVDPNALPHHMLALPIGSSE